MSTQNTFTPFDPLGETWDSYVARFECFLISHAYTELSGDRKRAYFLGFCGPDMFETARALFAPTSIHEIPWDDFLKKLKDHYAPAPSRCARRHVFYHRNQQEGESINAYLAALRRAALYCEFTDLEDYLLDRLVFGVRDTQLKRRLLAMPSLTFDKALAEARASELSSASLAVMTPTTQTNLTSDEPAVSKLPQELEKSLALEEEVCRLAANKQPDRAAARPSPTPPTPCRGCGANHFRALCPFKDATCRRCGRQGHIGRVCNASRRPPTAFPAHDGSSQPQRWQPRDPVNRRFDCNIIHTSTPPRLSTVGSTVAHTSRKISVSVLLGSSPCQLELDTGSAHSLISWNTIKQHFPRLQLRDLRPCNLRLRDYQGRDIPVLGQAHVPVSFKSFHGQLPLLIVNGPFTSLLGLDWFDALGFQITGINNIVTPDVFSLLTQEFPSVFSDSLGLYKGTPINFSLDPSVSPIRLKPRRIPLALRPKVDAELDRLIAQGILEPIDQASWETPIVVVPKPAGGVRLCGDFKCTVNRALAPHSYPVPVVDHVLHSLGEGTVFAKLDLSQAYQQLPVTNETAEIQTICTHRGTFKCHRLQFGISTAPGIFQGLIERLLYGIPGTVPYFDDVLVSASSKEELLARVRQVLTKFKLAGLTLKANKCSFAVPSVEFLGFRVDKYGIHPTPEKTAAITQAPPPRSKQELQAFLGLLNFYAPFIPHKASLAEPLHRLLDKGSRWQWGPSEDAAFAAVKAALTSNAVLIQYSPNLPLVLTCDASPYGVGAVLSHKLPNGTEAPISFYSRTLAGPERNYAQLDREALALIAGVRRFHHYLYGRVFDLITDHQPLLGLLSGHKQSPEILSPRMSRWILFLANYSYKLNFRSGKTIAHADALSRCPLPTILNDPAPASPILAIDDSPILLTATDIASATAKDPVLSTVLNWVLKGWPLEKPPPQFAPFLARKTELSTMKGCLLWGPRVIIPPKHRLSVLNTLHRGHPGIVRMKALARGYIWWPGLDSEIETWVARCSPCQNNQSNPPRAKPLQWEPPTGPWSRLHIDLAGPMGGQMFLVIVDAASKWLEVSRLVTTNSSTIITQLTALFATHGIPDIVVTDNGPQFTSAEFEHFLARLGTRHTLAPPWHPASNGQAERLVRVTKESLKKITHGDWQHRIAELLLTQHSTPCTVTGKSPAEILMGRKIRITLDRLHPTYVSVAPPQDTPCRTFSLGDRVFARSYSGQNRWEPGEISTIKGPRAYLVKLPDGRIWHRHTDQLRPRVPAGTIPSPHQADSSQQSTNHAPILPLVDETPQADFEETSEATPSPGPASPAQPSSPRRSCRVRRRPLYLADYACAS